MGGSVVPSLVPNNPPSVSAGPSSQPSAHPSASAAPSSQPSMGPSLSTIPSSQPSSAPTAGLVIRNPVFDPCIDTEHPLVGVTVVLYNYRAVPLAETVTDE